MRRSCVEADVGDSAPPEGGSVRWKPSELTLQSIARHVSPLQGRVAVFNCGCEFRPRSEAWSLCSYHEGFEDGIEACE